MQYREQVSNIDCGISVIQSMYKFYYDKWLSLSYLKNNVEYNEHGVNILELTQLMKKIGLQGEVLEGEFDSFKKIKLSEPIIAILKNENFFHYVIVYKITNKNNIIYIDPVYGKIKKSFNDFEKEFINIIIVCKKIEVLNDNFKTINVFKTTLTKEQIWLLLISFFTIISTFIGTYYMKVMIDQIIPSNNVWNLVIISILFLLISFIKLIFNFIVDFLTFRSNIKYQSIYIEKYINKFSNIKWNKIQHYDESMHLKNIEMIFQISSFQSKYFFNLISQITSLTLSIIFLFVINFELFLLSILSICLLILITLAFRKKIDQFEKISINNSIIFKRNFLNIINGFDQYKMQSINKILDLEFDKSFQKIIKNQIELKNTYQKYSMLQSIINTIFPFILIGISIIQIWQGTLSLGQVFIFISIYSFFLNPSFFLISLLIERTKIVNYLDNINSFFLIEEEQNIQSNKKINKIKNIKLKNINFKYPNKNKNLKINELNINKNLNLIGSNGSGKSTLLKIIATLIDDQEMYINNNHILHYDINSIKKEICLIQQNDYLPNGTIYNFLISCNNNDPGLLLNNIDKYQLLDLFNLMDLNLSTVIEDNGKKLSTGQKQFILIMRLFASNYSVILLDEVFENINSSELNKIFEILKQYLKNKIVIEVSHQGNYVFQSKVINCEQFNT